MKGYVNANPREDEIYEIVCLLRINGALINRNGPRSFTLKMGRGRGAKWTEYELTVGDLKAQYGHGTPGYAALRKHQRANTVPVAKRPNSRVPKRNAALVG